VHVQVRYRLAGVVAHVQHEPIAAIKAGLVRQPAGHYDEVAD
jgi:hypothetical protein